jgi:hypothetical protein
MTISKMFDAAVEIVRDINYADAVKELNNHIFDLKSFKCGYCTFWMTSKCLKEVNVDGRQRGPSCNDFGCGSFIRSQIYEKLINELTNELKVLKENHDYQRNHN